MRKVSKYFSHMYVVCLYVVCWLLLYVLLLRWNKTCDAEWNARILACLHAFLVCRAVEYYYKEWPWSLQEFGRPNTIYQNRILEFTASYFVFHAFNGFLMQVESIVMHIHHITSLMAVLSTYYINSSGYEILQVLWAAEFTNPFLQFRWFMRSMELHTTKLAVINEIIFVAMFVINRMGFLMYMSFHMFFVVENVHCVVKYTGFIILLINVTFMKQIIMFIRKRVGKKHC